MHPVKLLGRAAGAATHTIRHPVESVAYAAGMARGIVAAVISGTTRTGQDTAPGTTPAGDRAAPGRATATPGVSTSAAPTRPQRVAKPVPDPADLPEPVVIEASAEAPGEAFTTEPKATSRRSEHGGPDDEAEIDQWAAEAGAGPDIDIQQPGTEPLLDPGTAKAIRSEAAMMQKAADPNRG
jgi:hypothetical protein